MPDMHFKLYPHGGHWASISKSPEIIQDIRDFIVNKDTAEKAGK